MIKIFKKTEDTQEIPKRLGVLKIIRQKIRIEMPFKSMNIQSWKYKYELRTPYSSIFWILFFFLFLLMFFLNIDFSRSSF